jgi:hypothetical protein
MLLQESDDAQRKHDTELKEYETAMDELEHQLKEEMNQQERDAAAKYTPIH